jgi:hypothetical protein
MIACAPHKTNDELNEEFKINSGKDFDALALVTREMAPWTSYVKPFAWPRSTMAVVPSWHSTIINWDQTLSTTRPQLLNMFSI